jgi:hypothetical protein
VCHTIGKETELNVPTESGKEEVYLDPLRAASRDCCRLSNFVISVQRLKSLKQIFCIPFPMLPNVGVERGNQAAVIFTAEE